MIEENEHVMSVEKHFRLLRELKAEIDMKMFTCKCMDKEAIQQGIHVVTCENIDRIFKERMK